jgi:hypothetical protein
VPQGAELREKSQDVLPGATDFRGVLAMSSDMTKNKKSPSSEHRCIRRLDRIPSHFPGFFDRPSLHKHQAHRRIHLIDLAREGLAALMR